MNAAKTAQMRAANSMCSLIIGEQAAWQGGFSQETQEGQKQFNSVASEDPATGQNSVSAESLEEDISSFLSTMKQKNEYAFFSKGQLPPGLNATRWISEDGDWSYAAYIYNPGMTMEASKLKEKMNQNSILGRGNSLLNSSSKIGGSQTKGSTSGNKEAPKSPQEVGRGPSGSVSKDDDL